MMRSLLATKFFAPHPRADLVSRPRLLQKLSDGLGFPVVLISAPAGFGKTTLLSEWQSSPFAKDWLLAWLSLEGEDNDPARFLDYLGGALETCIPRVRSVLRDAPEDFSPSAKLPRLIEELNRISSPLVLILEDYHIITAKAVHELIAFLFQHRPVHFHIMISSRGDPPLPLARWRLRDELTEIRADELRFNHAEIVAFLGKMAGEALPEEAIVTLETRTEGWIAGIKLAALSLKSTPHADVTEFMQTLSGNHRLIADYLLEEVINHQPEPVRSFMLQTSILPSLSGELCDAITGQQNGQEMLEFLERENLFIVQLDQERVWYRYHHLFADLLRQRLEQRYPGLSNDLRRQAAEWYLQNQYPECAIDEALEIGDYRLAADWISRMRASMVGNGRRATVTQWVTAIPDTFLANYPELKALRSEASPQLLTAREQDVMVRIAAGDSNQEIAAALTISLGTVKKHINNIFAKLNAHNRTQALARARELGLL